MSANDTSPASESTIRLPTTADAESVHAAAGDWVAAPALRDLVRAFGGELPAGAPSTVLDRLAEFSARHWDFRHGRERHEAARADVDAATADAVRTAATVLGLRGRVRPRFDSYDHVLVLGGMAKACLGRSRFAARLLTSVTAPTVTALGGYRPLNRLELDVTDAREPCRFEVDALELGLRLAFDSPAFTERSGGDPDVDPATAWCRRESTGASGLPLRVVAAPSSDPGARRANTADTCRYWAEEASPLRGGERILVVTTEVYVPFQHCDALAVIGLRHGCVIDTVGHDPSLLDDDLRLPPPTTAQYLQEIRSTILSMRRLVAAVDAEG